MNRARPVTHDRSRAKSLRRRPTAAESKMWTLLRGRRFAEFKFRRQHPFGPYTLDFYCESLKFAVELDGSGHMQPTRSSQDTVRTLFLEQHGLTVLRFWNTDVLKNAAVVLQKLLDVAEKKCQALK